MKISDDNLSYVFFVSGEVGVFIPWAANTGVRAFAFGLNDENHENMPK